MYARCSRVVFKDKNLSEQSAVLDEGKCLRHAHC